jgi:hypothetical protein
MKYIFGVLFSLIFIFFCSHKERNETINSITITSIIPKINLNDTTDKFDSLVSTIYTYKDYQMALTTSSAYELDVNGNWIVTVKNLDTFFHKNNNPIGIIINHEALVKKNINKDSFYKKQFSNLKLYNLISSKLLILVNSTKSASNENTFIEKYIGKNDKDSITKLDTCKLYFYKNNSTVDFSLSKELDSLNKNYRLMKVEYYISYTNPNNKENDIQTMIVVKYDNNTAYNKTEMINKMKSLILRYKNEFH